MILDFKLRGGFDPIVFEARYLWKAYTEHMVYGVSWAYLSDLLLLHGHGQALKPPIERGHSRKACGGIFYLSV